MDEYMTNDNRPQNQPTELAEKANEVEQFINTSLQERQKYERQWYINAAFFMGYQWVDWNTAGKKLTMLYDPAHRKRVTVNKIMPSVLKEVGRMTNQRPKFFVVPDEPTQECKEIAKMGEDLLDTWDRNLEIPTKNKRLVQGMQIYGSMFKDLSWNPFAGEQVTNPETGELLPIGEIDQEILSPFQVAPEVGCIELEEMTKICVIKSRSLEWIK